MKKKQPTLAQVDAVFSGAITRWPRRQWRQEVAEEATELGYKEWLGYQVSVACSKGDTSWWVECAP